jgi:hypothetical protein
VSGFAPRALGDSVRPWRLIGASGRPLNFTVRQRLGRSVPSLGPFARAFVALNRVFGAFALVGGLCLLAKCAWHLLDGERHWSQLYFAVLFGVAMVLVGIVYLRAPVWRLPRRAVIDDSSQDR